MDADLLHQLENLEKRISYRQPPALGEVEFAYQTGRLPVLLTAPHGAAHFRNGRWKDEDEYTAGLALLTAAHTGAQALYVHHRSSVDHNFLPGSAFKQAIASLAAAGKVRFVLDLHGASDQRDFGLALGMMDGKSCPAQAALILSAFAGAGFTPDGKGLSRLDVDNFFKGAGGNHQETVTRYAVETLGLPAAQIEINATVRIVERLQHQTFQNPFHGNPDGIIRTIQALSAAVLKLAAAFR